MSASVAGAGAAGGAPTVVELYRDDGPLARALGGALGARVALAPLALVAVAAAVAWLVLAGALSQGRTHDGRFSWGVPVLLRLVEFGGLLWFAALAGASAVPAAFALLAALAFRHYDVVYRLRYQGVSPPAWLGVAAGGWEGRLLIGFALLAAGALPAGFFVAAALLAVVLVGESAAGWMRFERAQRPPLYSDEEDENQ